MPSIRGTASVSDGRALNKALRSTRFPASFSKRLNVGKVDRGVVSQWIEKKIAELLGFEDEIVQSTAINLFLPTPIEDGPPVEVDPRKAQIDLAGFLGESEAAKFALELWEMLLDAQESAAGIPRKLVEAKKKELDSVNSLKRRPQVKDQQPQQPALRSQSHQIAPHENQNDHHGGNSGPSLQNHSSHSRHRYNREGPIDENRRQRYQHNQHRTEGQSRPVSPPPPARGWESNSERQPHLPPPTRAPPLNGPLYDEYGRTYRPQPQNYYETSGGRSRSPHRDNWQREPRPSRYYDDRIHDSDSYHHGRSRHDEDRDYGQLQYNDWRRDDRGHRGDRHRGYYRGDERGRRGRSGSYSEDDDDDLGNDSGSPHYHRRRRSRSPDRSRRRRSPSSSSASTGSRSSRSSTGRRRGRSSSTSSSRSRSRSPARRSRS